MLVDGMVEALEKKAKEASVHEVLDRERIELETMISTMQKAHGDTLPEMFVGLNHLAKALFERVQSNLKDSKSEDLGTECRAVGEAFVYLLSETEKRSEQLRATSGKNIPPDKFAKELAEWVLRQNKTSDKQAPVLN